MIHLVLNSSEGTNFEYENLTCWANVSHAEGYNVTYTGVWIKNNEALFNSTIASSHNSA